MRTLFKIILWLLFWPLLLPIWIIKRLVRGRTSPQSSKIQRQYALAASRTKPRPGRLRLILAGLIGFLFLCGVISNLAPKQPGKQSGLATTMPTSNGPLVAALAPPTRSETVLSTATPGEIAPVSPTSTPAPLPTDTVEPAPLTATHQPTSSAPATEIAEPPTMTPTMSPTPSPSPTATALPPTPTFTPTAAWGEPALVEQIVDGDTIAVRINDQIYSLRYIGIDTPETGQPFAAEATAQNRALVAGKTVYLQKDVSETDKYKRLLRYVYLADGTFVNLELVKQGYAHAVTYPPDVRHEAQLRQAQQEATSAGRGLWQWPVANRAANLRGGPSTDYPVIAGVKQGQMLTLIAQNAAGDWYELDNHAWIAAALVDRAPATLALAAAIPTLPPPPPTVTPAPAQQPVQPAPPPAAPEGSAANVRLQSVMYDGAVARVESDEYAIIVNTGSAAANIGGWRLNAGDPGQDFVFPNFTLAPRQAVRVYTDEHHPDSGGFTFGSGKAIWNNKGDCGYLYDASGAEVDQYCY